jgi:lipopolysaccharide transport system ATP-binding protein
MTDLAIRVSNLSKLYRIGENDTHRTLRDALANSVKRPVRAARSWLKRENRSQTAENTIWALKDVSFDVKRGEAVGIIGRNGAGKSTLLKILSRITEPTEGRVEGYGRVGSLLEVGTGFHPELTGRENIYLNGAILGMTRAEINRKFDEIVAFSEIEKFLDTPVKRYSSGMYVRLAFAVAAHLEPEILIVDEVLAVGDAAFQKKCLGKMGDVTQEGRTVLFVSHNMAAVQSLCSRAIVLNNGVIVAGGTATTAVSSYLKMMEGPSCQDLSSRTDRHGKGQIKLAQVEIATGDDNSATLVTGRPARFAFYTTTARAGMSCSFTIYDQFGQRVTFFDSALHGQEDLVNPEEGNTKFLCEIDEFPLLPGRYRLNAAIMLNGEVQDHIEAAAFLEVEPGNAYGRPVPRQTGYCNVIFKHRWTTPI